MYTDSQLHWQKLTEEDENLLIKVLPNEYARDLIEPVGGVDYRLWGGNSKCNHLVQAESSGCRCVKCGAWYCA